MKPWRAALTSATASGKSTRIASRSAIVCSSTPPCVWICASAAAVSSTAVLSVSVANCSRCASCTVSACCSANSRSPRRRSSGSPPNGKPPSIPSSLGEGNSRTRRHLCGELLHGRKRVLERDGEGRAALVPERLLEPARRGAERIEIVGAGHARLGPQGRSEGRRRLLGLFDPFRVLGLAQLRETRAQRVEVAAARRLLGDLA